MTTNLSRRSAMIAVADTATTAAVSADALTIASVDDRATSLSTAPAGNVQGAIVQTWTYDPVCSCARDLDLVADVDKRLFGSEQTHRFQLPDYTGFDAELWKADA